MSQITQEAFDELKLSTDKLVSENASLTAQLEQAETDKQNLVSENEELQARNADLLNTVTTLRAQILQAGASAKTMKEKPTIPSAPVEYNGKKYAFTRARFILPGKGVITAQDASIDDDVIAAILAIKGQTVLKEIFN